MEQIRIDLIPGGVTPNAHASQYDIGRVIRFKLYNNKVPYTLAGTETITIDITKPDGVEETITLTNTSSDYVDFITEDGLLNQAGIYECEFRITDGGDDIGTQNFNLRAEADAKGAVIIMEAQGNPAHFETDLAGALVSCIVDISYNASGYKSALVLNTSNTPTTNETPYLFRPSYANGYGYETLIGGTCGVNQLVNTGDTSVNTISGHKYLTRINGVESIIQGGSAVSINDSSEDNVIDLSAYFGTTIADYVYTLESGTAGAGIAWLKANGFFTADYYPYNAGGLLSVKTSKKITTGKNLFNYDLSDATSGAKYVQMKVPNGTYTMSSSAPLVEGAAILFFMAGYQTSGVSTGTNGVSNGTSRTVTTTDGYITFAYRYIGTPPVYPADFNTQIEINNQATAFEPYVSHEYPLDDIELRGILKLDASNNLYYDGDTYESNGSVTRKYGIVNLGDLEWEYVADNGYMYASFAQPRFGSYGYQYISSYSKFVYSETYTASQAWSGGYEGLYVCPVAVSSTPRIYAKDSSYTSASDFKTAMQNANAKLVYELATPTTETADTFTNPMIVDGNGTEQFVDGRTVEMPVGHETIYGEDMKARFTDFGVTVYGGTYNLTTGVLTSTKNADGTDKGTPETYQLTPVYIPVRNGDNYIADNTNGDAHVKFMKKA